MERDEVDQTGYSRDVAKRARPSIFSWLFSFGATVIYCLSATVASSIVVLSRNDLVSFMAGFFFSMSGAAWVFGANYDERQDALTEPNV